MLSPELIRDLLLPEIHFSFEKFAAMQHEAAWADVAAKAKRLVQDGQVTILRNAPHHIMAHVVGDHGEYNLEISRHDPSSQIIEQWNCECPWAQFAFDRTRKWKKLEGRVCSHVLAAYWKAKSTPLDMSDTEPGFQVPRGQMPGAQPGQETIPGMPFAAPDVEKAQKEFQAPAEGPGEDNSPSERDTLPPEDTGGVPSKPGPKPGLPHTDDLTLPKRPETPFQNEPKQPQTQYEQLHLFDVTAPPGMQPVPGASPVSIPGGRPATPGNPIAFPGTFSHFIPIMTLRTSNFIYAGDALTDYFETQRAARQPIYVTLTNLVTLELSGGKIPVPGAMPYGTSSEGVPLYKVMELGFNPETGMRENVDVNMLQGAPEQTGTYTDVPPGRRGEVVDFDPNLRMAYVVIPLNYPEGGDVRLHPHSLKGWVDYSDIRPAPRGITPWRKGSADDDWASETSSRF